MTRANVLQIGLATLFLGAFGYCFFRLIGFEGVSAGIAAEAILVLLVFGWTGTYLFRVVSGQMTFVEQRKRYRDAYEKVTNAELQSRFEAMSEEEQISLIKELENE
ncbi:DUF3007 family protein [Prochlorococcus sp. MIT 1307]|uniref:DUF3007 family protein n=1 Tax=Prochlorococcus sp. MIT 1307 TaxID=3096219 RepID=UPI002A763BDE|nr:DUF3007 family protein [Prochlorococcus sp. MIT 1307]